MSSNIWLGTSGFAYKEWKPSFYPGDVPQKRFLDYYATRLSAVEIDYTFYRMPSRKTLESWRAATPDSFRFALKASRKITHWERLRLPSEALDYLTSIVPVLKDRLGILLYQLPPNFKIDLDRLELFVASLPQDIAAAFEFRHESWFCDGVYSLLEKYGGALCIHDADAGTTPLRLTAARTYVRLRKSAYSDPERAEWQKRLRAWADSGVEVYAFIKHEDNPDAPRIALEFAAGLQS